MAEIKEIDISPIIMRFGRISPEHKYEVRLVELYEYVNKPYDSFTKWYLKEIYNDDKDHEPHEISAFHNIATYQNILVRLISELDKLIVSGIGHPNFKNIKYLSTKILTDTEYIIEVEVK